MKHQEMTQLVLKSLKNDAETLGMPQGDATLEGAEFTVTYYADYYTKEEIAQGKPEEDKVEKRTWVLQTKKASTGQYIASLNDYWKVSGDELLQTRWYANITFRNYFN